MTRRSPAAPCARTLLLLAGILVAHARAPPGLEQHPRPADLAAARRLHTLAMGVTRHTMMAGNTIAPASSPPPVRSGASVGAAGGSRFTVDPVTFGADPTGETDSTAAFAKAMAALLNTSAHAADPMASNIKNLGGATLDLGGGEFVVSEPLVVSPYLGNVRISGGSLRASKSFPAGRYLIEVGSPDCKPADQQGVCNEFVDVHDVFLDASHTAAGCVAVYATMGMTVGPSAFLTGFNVAGVFISKGHETMVRA